MIQVQLLMLEKPQNQDDPLLPPPMSCLPKPCCLQQILPARSKGTGHAGAEGTDPVCGAGEMGWLWGWWKYEVGEQQSPWPSWEALWVSLPWLGLGSARHWIVGSAVHDLATGGCRDIRDQRPE